MAGNYMDAPGNRLAYDRDGTVGVWATAAGVVTQLTSGQLQAMNSEAEASVPITGMNRVALVFPTPVDIRAVFLALDSGSWLWETSVDTTTGLDGTWVTQSPVLTGLNNAVKPNYRIQANLKYPTSTPQAANVRGIRIRFSSTTVVANNPVRVFHIYADLASGATSQRIAFWMPSTNVPVSPTHFDWGNAPRATTDDKTFRIKNLSSTLTANDIELYVEALTPGTPVVSGMHTLSIDDGATFQTVQAIATLAPGEVSDVIILRRVVPSNAQVSVWSARISADVSEWI